MIRPVERSREGHAGAEAALEALIARRREYLVWQVMRKRFARPAAEDIVQETLLRAWRKLPNDADLARHGGRLESWVGVLLAHAIADHARGHQPTEAITAITQDPPVQDAPLERVLRAQVEAEIDRYCSRRQALALKAALDDAGEVRISALLGVSRLAARKLLYSGRVRMRQAAQATHEALRQN